MSIPIPLQEALRDSITSGTFVDTKFWVFSKRRSNPGRVGGPKALFVNEHVAKRVPRLGALLDERKIKEDLRVRFPLCREPYTSGYDYEDDSDLEDDDEDILDSGGGPAAASQVAGEKAGNYSEHVTVENSNTKSDDSQGSDIISVSDFDSLCSESPDTNFDTNPAPSAHVGKVVVIEDVAFITFQALLCYLYTDEIEFAPWGSAKKRKARAKEPISKSYGIPKPSPKSIYRLADKYDIPELKELALRQIQQDLPKCNITEEVFSRYTSWYPELSELELRELARVLLSSDSGPTLESFKEKVKCYTHGELPHAGHVISTLYELMESDESVEEKSITVAVSVNQQGVGNDWVGLKKALTNSLASGTFLDSQFYAVESRSSADMPKLRPIYFCSTVGGSFMSKLMTCSSKLGSQRALLRQVDGCDSDIDIEQLDQEGSSERYPRFKCIRESPTPMDLPLNPALLLNHGAAKTWSTIFLYVYTGQIKFAATSSQAMAISKEVQDGHSGDEPKPLQDQKNLGALSHDFIAVEQCSPKSIYCLANKVGLTGLRGIAFEDIRSKLDGDNIVEEMFSPFTAEHKDIRDIEHGLYWSMFKPLVDRTLLSNIIEGSSLGEHPHRTAAMELVLERSIQERRKRMLVKMKDASQQDPTTQNPSNEVLTPQPQPPAPVPAPQPPSKSTSNPALVKPSAKIEGSPSTPSESRKEARGVRRKELAASSARTSPLKHTAGPSPSSRDSKPRDSFNTFLYSLGHSSP